MVYVGGLLRPILDDLAAKAWRGIRGDEAGQFLLQSSDLAPGASPESMHKSLAALYGHARRWAPGLEVPFLVPPVRVRIGPREVAGTFDVDEESYASINVSIDHVGDPEATLLILSHEACHHILRQSRLNHPDNVDRDEITTDLTMFICGFGDLVLGGYSRLRVNHGEVGRGRVHLGYLSSLEYQEAYDYVLSLRASQGLPGRIDLMALVAGESARSPSKTERGVDGTAYLGCGDAMCKHTFRTILRRQGKPWPVRCPACGVSLYPVDVLQHEGAGEMRAELRLPSDGGLVECTSDTLWKLTKPIDAGAPPPQDVAALFAGMLDAASLSQDTLVPGRDAEPPVPSKSSAPRLPSQGRAVLLPLKRPEPPSRAAPKRMSEEVEWTQLELDEKMARRQGLPASIPVPKGQFEVIAEQGLSVDLCREWVNDFMLNSKAGKSGVWRKKNAAIVSSLEAFVDKGPLWDKAQKAFAENDYERAITTLKRIASMDPVTDDHAARLDLASALATTGDYPGALKAFKAVKKTFEGEPDYHVRLGHVHLALNDKDSALNEMALALEARPDYQAALDAMAQLGILAVAEYLSSRRARAAAEAEEKASAIAAAKAAEKASAIAAAKAEEKALAEARAKIKSATADTDTSPRLPDEFEPPKAVPGTINMARLPELNDHQWRQKIKQGTKALAEGAAKAGEKDRIEGPAQEKALTGATEVEALLALVNLEPEGPAPEKVLTGAASGEARAKTKENVAGMQERVPSETAAEVELVLMTQENALAEAVAKAEKALAEAAAETEFVAKMQKRVRADRAEADVIRLQERILAGRTKAAEAEKALAAKAEKKALNEAVAGAKEEVRKDALAKTKEKAASLQEKAGAETATKEEKAVAEAVVAKLQENPRPDHAEEANRAEAAVEVEEKARDEVVAKAKEMTNDDAIARAKEMVARAKEMALDEATAKTKERARSVRQAILLVAALIIAVALAILGRRMFLY
jgi:hypothetical protein